MIAALFSATGKAFGEQNQHQQSTLFWLKEALLLHAEDGGEFRETKPNPKKRNDEAQPAAVEPLTADSVDTWLVPEAASYAITEFERYHGIRKDPRDPTYPFITGDGFRSVCRHICDETNGCKVNVSDIQTCDCIFVKSDLVAAFTNLIMPKINESVAYTLVTHNGDISVPDGQSDAPVGHKRQYFKKFEAAFNKGQLIALHSQNLWWSGHNRLMTSQKPAFLHCLPIGIENAYNKIGRNASVYVEAMRKNILGQQVPAAGSIKKLLLVAFGGGNKKKPDRDAAIDALRVTVKENGEFYTQIKGKLSHVGWLDAVADHRFTLAPHGHGLDTHRMMEIYLMGGVPVIKRSTITSCFDDSDNIIGIGTAAVKRGSLPVVVVDHWVNVTRDLLEMEWKRIASIPRGHWDWKRLFLGQWQERIKSCHVRT